MRMWMIPVQYLCNKHLNGEHYELHKHRHMFLKKQSIKGRILPTVLIEPSSMKVRHEELVSEMLKRGMNHDSPYEQPDLSHLSPEQRYAKVDWTISYRDLANRCKDCKHRIGGN
jgi:hypothetical protein